MDATETDAIKRVAVIVQEMSDGFREVPEFLGLNPGEILGCVFGFIALHKKRISPEIMVGSIIGITQHANRHISLAIPKIRFGESFCERLLYFNGVWTAVDVSGLQYAGALVITKR